MTLAFPLFLAAFSHIDWLILIAYFGLMGLVGILAALCKNHADAVGYFLAERSMPVWAIALSVVATSLSVATFLGAAQQSYTGDLTYLSQNLGVFIAAFIVAGLFIPRFFAAGTVTIYGFLEQRLGQPSRVAVSCMFLLGRLVASGVRLFMAAIPVCMLIFGDNDPSRLQMIIAIIAIGAIGTAYTIFGGIRAVIWTDVIQVAIILGAVILSIGLLLHRIPIPASQIIDTLAQTPGKYPDGGTKLRLFDFSFNPAHSFTLWTALIGAAFLNTATLGVDHDLAQRMLTAKAPWRGGLSLILSQFVAVIVVGAFMAVGLLLYIFYKRPDIMGPAAPVSMPVGSTKVYAHFLIHELPPGISGLAMAGIFAVAQGSLVSAINAMASSVVADLYWPLRQMRGQPIDTSVKAPRLAVAGMGAALMLFAIAAAMIYNPKTTTLLDFALDVMSFALSGMLAVFLTALLTKRGNNTSVMLALATGALVTFLLWDDVMLVWTLKLGHSMKLAGFWRMPIATAAAFAVCMSGMKRPEEEERGFEVVEAV